MRSIAFAVLGLISSLTAQSHNTLLLIADDVGVDAIGAYRESTGAPPTTNIDALAQGGVLFRQCWANPVCSPTRATVLTGRYGFRTGIGQVIENGEPGLSYAETLLPEVLATVPVGNALIGKWHLGERSGVSTPNVAGFAHFAGAIGGGLPSYTSWPKVVNGARSTSTTYATTFEVDEALAWIAAHQEPWCLIVAFHAGHTPLHAPPAHLHSQNLVGLNPDTTPGPFFLAMIEALDREIGRLLGALPTSVRGRTNVIFLGDNGTTSAVTIPPFPTSHAKGTLYQGGIRVPLIVNGPSVSGAPREVGEVVNACDLFATIGELHGIDVRTVVPATTPLDCVSLAPYLRSASQPPLRSHAYSELFANGSASMPRNHGWAIRDSRYKLIRWDERAQPTEAFFDLVADPFEQTDLIATLTAAERFAYENLQLAAARLRGAPLVLGYGAGCAGSAGVPTLAAAAGPLRGTPFALTTGSLAPAVATTLCALGLSRDAFGVVPLPFDLGPAGMPGCFLRASLDHLQVLPVAAGKATWNLGIPNDQSLFGGSVFFQAIVPEPGANAAGVVLSAGLLAVIG